MLSPLDVRVRAAFDAGIVPTVAEFVGFRKKSVYRAVVDRSTKHDTRAALLPRHPQNALS